MAHSLALEIILSTALASCTHELMPEMWAYCCQALAGQVLKQSQRRVVRTSLWSPVPELVPLPDDAVMD